MSIQTIIKMLTDSGVERNEAECEVKLLLEGLLNYTEKDKVKGRLLEEADEQQLLNAVKIRIEKKIPVQYIIGKSWFMGEYFKVTPDVLIPRDETEILVKNAIDIVKKYKLESVLDIGTGSGCIACTIAKQTDATVLGIDISSDALRIALDNVTALGINNKAVFRKSNLFEKVRAEESFDLIISNPPYIPLGTELQEEVVHEPEIALYAKDDGFEFYKQIIKEAPQYLNNNGFLMFEVGINQAKKIASMMNEYFGEIRIIKDLAEIDRVVIGKLIK